MAETKVGTNIVSFSIFLFRFTINMLLRGTSPSASPSSKDSSQ